MACCVVTLQGDCSHEASKLIRGVIVNCTRSRALCGAVQSRLSVEVGHLRCICWRFIGS